MTGPTTSETVKHVYLHLPARTIFTVLAVALLSYVTILLVPLFMTIFFASMLAVTLFPLLEALHRRGFRSWVGVAVISGGMILAVSLFLVAVLPPLVTQTSMLVEKLPALKQAILDHLTASPTLHALAERALGDLALPAPSSFFPPLVSAGAVAASGITQFFLVLIFAIYLLVDGPRTTNWILAFFSMEKRDKLKATAREVSVLVSAYVAGQVITSLLCGAFTFVVLLLLGVPAALTLALLAAVCDVLPVLGFFLAAIPAVLLALTVSPLTALLVLALYGLYHAIENYYLVPKVYGSRLRLSDLVVLVSLLAAGTVGGAAAAIAILPLVASFPIIERIWLVELLGRGVVKRHADAAAQTDAEKLEART